MIVRNNITQVTTSPSRLGCTTIDRSLACWLARKRNEGLLLGVHMLLVLASWGSRTAWLAWLAPQAQSTTLVPCTALHCTVALTRGRVSLSCRSVPAVRAAQAHLPAGGWLPRRRPPGHQQHRRRCAPHRHARRRQRREYRAHLGRDRQPSSSTQLVVLQRSTLASTATMWSVM